VRDGGIHAFTNNSREHHFLDETFYLLFVLHIVIIMRSIYACVCVGNSVYELFMGLSMRRRLYIYSEGWRGSVGKEFRVRLTPLGNRRPQYNGS
jgi:hypothetical protein